MKLNDVKDFCHVFYKRFSALDLNPLQLKYDSSSDSLSIALVKKNMTEDTEAAIAVNHDTMRLLKTNSLKTNSFEDIDTCFTFDTPLELYTNLLTLLLMCCHISKVLIAPSEAIAVTLGREIKTWRELVIFICSLCPEEQAKVTVLDDPQNSLKFLKTVFLVTDGVFITDGLFKSQTPYKDTLELVRAVLDAVSAVFKSHDYVVNPFPKKNRRSGIRAVANF